MMVDERKYIAISIKHTMHRWKFGMPCVLWGNRTQDNEERSYSGYTIYPNQAELYSISEFQKKYGNPHIFKYDFPVHMELTFCKKWEKYDTVFVSADEYVDYCTYVGIPIEDRRADNA